MFVAVVNLDLRVPHAHSLKDKRTVVKGVIAEARKLACAAAEVGYQDLQQRTAIAVVSVAAEGYHARRVVHEVERVVEQRADVEVLAATVTLLGPGELEP